jgi:hypothetical protein
MKQYHYKKVIGFTEQQRQAFVILEDHGVNVNKFIRQAIAEKIKKVGLYLKSIRKEKKLTYYAVAKASGLNIGQVQAIEAGNKAYTFDSFLQIIHALDCYFFLEDKDGKHLDFANMAKNP